MREGKIEVTDSSTWSPHLRAAVSEITRSRDGEIRIKLHSKTAALEVLARHLSMFKDNVDLNVSVSLADLVNGSYELERQRDAKTIEHQAQQISAPDETTVAGPMRPPADS